MSTLKNCCVKIFLKLHFISTYLIARRTIRMRLLTLYYSSLRSGSPIRIALRALAIYMSRFEGGRFVDRIFRVALVSRVEDNPPVASYLWILSAALFTGPWPRRWSRCHEDSCNGSILRYTREHLVPSDRRCKKKRSESRFAGSLIHHQLLTNNIYFIYHNLKLSNLKLIINYINLLNYDIIINLIKVGNKIIIG